MRDTAIWLAGSARTPIGRFGGTLAPLSAPDLGEAAARGALSRAGVEASAVDQSIFGHGRQAGQGPSTGRQVAVRAGVPVESPAYTVNMACGSGLKSVLLGADAIRLGQAEIVLAGGMESMSNTPYFLPRARWGYRLGHDQIVDGMYQDGFHCKLADQLMGETAENLVDRYGIPREEQDRYALSSQQRAQAARERGRFDAEKVAIQITDRKKGTYDFTADEHARDNVTIEQIAKLPPVFRKNGTVHAGNSSGITDGAAAIVVLGDDAVKQHGVTPEARLVAYAEAGVEPREMGLGPVPAVRKLLEKTGLSIDDIDLWELNEAFAAQVLACNRELGIDLDRMNVDGGSIALGHPIGATGCRILVTLLHSMKERGAKRGVATLCISGGLGLAALVERGV
ncbi:MAG: thiolase family protein [Planctomycetes bacterium]|nr:thiolase family protein [Planctomycetota bacterium]MCB9824378.1 thiolase family protein [Planctomycetota bacterium]MCB9828601.1 thiolase family protein [Planctomycetota bacterium]MCB9900375.1 thiolase family protein [Planctomycetota bacterium]